MKRKNEAVDRKNLTVEQTLTRHEILYRAQFCLLECFARESQKQKFVKQGFVADPVVDARERF